MPTELSYQPAPARRGSVFRVLRRFALNRRVLPFLIVAGYLGTYVFLRLSGMLVHQVWNPDMDNPAAPRGEVHDIGSVMFSPPTSQGPSEFVAVCHGVFYPLIHAELKYWRHQHR